MSATRHHIASSTGNVEMRTAPSSPNRHHHQHHQQNLSTVIADNNTREHLITKLTKTGLPQSFLLRLLQDSVDVHSRYQKLSSIDEIDAVPPNSSYFGNMCTSLCCNSGFLVEQGTLGRGQIDDQFVWFAPGYHKINDFGSKVRGTVKTAVANFPQINGYSGFVTISDGNVGVLLVDCEYKLLCPGVWSWRSTSIKYEATVDITQSLARLGPFTLITCPQSICSVSFHNGTLKILGWQSDQDEHSSYSTREKNKQFQYDGDLETNDEDALHLLDENTNHNNNNQTRRRLTSKSNNNSNKNDSREPSANASTNASFDDSVKIKRTLPMTMMQQEEDLIRSVLDQQQQQQSLFTSCSSSRTFFLDDPLWHHTCFLTLKVQTDLMEAETGLLTKDNIDVAIKIMAEWRIVNPVLAILGCASDMNKIRGKVDALVRATIARIIASTKIAHGSDTAGISLGRGKNNKNNNNISFGNEPVKNPLLGVVEENNNDDENENENAEVEGGEQQRAVGDDDDENSVLPPTPAGGKQGTAMRKTEKGDDNESELVNDAVNNNNNNNNNKNNNDGTQQQLQFINSEQEQEETADLSNLMRSKEAARHVEDLRKNLGAVGVEVLGLYVPERRMVEDDIRSEIASQCLIGIKSEAERSASDANAYSVVTLARAQAESKRELANAEAYKTQVLAKAEAQAILDVCAAFAAGGLKLGNPNDTGARLALSEIVAKSFKDASVTLFTSKPDTIPHLFSGPVSTMK